MRLGDPSAPVIPLAASRRKNHGRCWEVSIATTADVVRMIITGDARRPAIANSATLVWTLWDTARTRRSNVAAPKSWKWAA